MKTYFLSDTHFGAGLNESHRLSLLSSFVEQVCKDGSALYLLGDIFDFWVEYQARPRKKYSQPLRELHKVVAAGIPVTLIRGNHEFMPTAYLETEMGMMVAKGPFELTYGTKKVLVLHGHELSKKTLFRLAHLILTNRFFQFLYLQLPENLGIAFADLLSRKSRKQKGEISQCSEKGLEEYHRYADTLMQKHAADILIMGHTHHAEQVKLAHGLYVNGGSWLAGKKYVTIDGDGDIELCTL